MTLVNELRMAADDLHSANGHNKYAALMSRAADEIESLKAKLKRYERADEDASLDRAIKAASGGGEGV